MKKYSKKWYLHQKVTVDKNRLTLWTKEEKLKIIINDLPYSFGGEHGMSVNNIYMRGRKNLMWVLEFCQKPRKFGEFGEILVHPILVFFNTMADTFSFKEIHSKKEFIEFVGKRNWKIYMKYSNLIYSLYKLD